MKGCVVSGQLNLDTHSTLKVTDQKMCGEFQFWLVVGWPGQNESWLRVLISDLKNQRGLQGIRFQGQRQNDVWGGNLRCSS